MSNLSPEVSDSLVDFNRITLIIHFRTHKKKKTHKNKSINISKDKTAKLRTQSNLHWNVCNVEQQEDISEFKVSMNNTAAQNLLPFVTLLSGCGLISLC